MEITGNALIVGGASGIGMACALTLARDGAAGIMIADLDLAAARAVASKCEQIAKSPTFRAEATHVDVTDEGSVKAAAASMASILGRIDYCIHCAGIAQPDHAHVADSDLSELRRELEVNTAGTFLVLREVATIMKAQELQEIPSLLGDARGATRGVIVVLGSASSYVATPGRGMYTTSKHAVMGLVKSAAIDHIQDGIRVNAVCPSWVNTPMLQQATGANPELEELIRTLVPISRIASAEEVADVVAFLCSPRSSYMVGCGVIVDGGTTLTGRV
ncbi:hypothetical protein BJY00DRAFT_288263 [Aspergillus carlsbadensis]|nr:hypothetical protein BJY00DRAFT_288263 [Aspergillus carlsbadensis]